MAQCLPLQRCSSLASPLEFLLEDLELISGRDSKQKFRVDDAIPSRKTQCSSQLQGVTPGTEDLILFFPLSNKPDIDREPGATLLLPI